MIDTVVAAIIGQMGDAALARTGPTMASRIKALPRRLGAYALQKASCTSLTVTGRGHLLGFTVQLSSNSAVSTGSLTIDGVSHSHTWTGGPGTPGYGSGSLWIAVNRECLTGFSLSVSGAQVTSAYAWYYLQ